MNQPFFRQISVEAASNPTPEARARIDQEIAKHLGGAELVWEASGEDGLTFLCRGTTVFVQPSYSRPDICVVDFREGLVHQFVQAARKTL